MRATAACQVVQHGSDRGVAPRGCSPPMQAKSTGRIALVLECRQGHRDGCVSGSPMAVCKLRRLGSPRLRQTCSHGRVASLRSDSPKCRSPKPAPADYCGSRCCGGGRQLFRFVRHLPVARGSATIRCRQRAGVSQSSGEETAASAAVVVAAYDAMEIVQRGLWLTSTAPPATTGPPMPRTHSGGAPTVACAGGGTHLEHDRRL
jgi:hypothetical protein